MSMKADKNKGIYTDIVRNVLDSCRYDHDELKLGDSDMNFSLRHLQDLPCLRVFLIPLEFIIHLIESVFPSLLLPNHDPILCNVF